MQTICFFLLIFCGIFGAYTLLKLLYDTILNIFGKGRCANAAKHGRIPDNNRNSRRDHI